MEHVYKPVSKVNKTAAELHMAKFMNVYSYYDYFRNENWNESAGHMFDFQKAREHSVFGLWYIVDIIKNIIINILRMACFKKWWYASYEIHGKSDPVRWGADTSV